MMRSLTWKLTLAFLLVGLTGAGLVAVFVRHTTQTAFNRFVMDQNQQSLVENLTKYYTESGSWEGVESAFAPVRMEKAPPAGDLPGTEARRVLFMIADPSGNVVFGGGPQYQGTVVVQKDLQTGNPIQVDGKTVGFVLFTPRLDRWRPGTPEGNFLTGVTDAIRWSAVIAVLVALLLGGFLASTLTRSLRLLTSATRELASGNLGQQVKIRSKDELGELAASFNQMSAELARSSTLRKQMSADIAHDLRNPLSVILGYSEAFAEGKLKPTPEAFEVLHVEAQHLNKLVDDFKTLSLADAGELPISLQLVSPDSLLKRIVSAQRVQAEQVGVSLTTRVEPRTGEIRVDAERMIQVLGNLLSNALRYTSKGGEVRLSARPEGGKVRIEVADNGAGIAAEDLPYIFERSYRGDRSRRQSNGEAGLGLAIARSIVEAMGGEIAVQSELGSGTTFSVWFEGTIQM